MNRRENLKSILGLAAGTAAGGMIGAIDTAIDTHNAREKGEKPPTPNDAEKSIKRGFYAGLLASVLTGFLPKDPDEDDGPELK